MARVPDPIPGLIFRYGYLWLHEFLAGRIDASKERPACLLMRVVENTVPGLRLAGGSAVVPGDMVILPITTRRPEPDQLAIELTAREKRACGLDFAVPSWLILSEFNADAWPNADLALVANTGNFAYGVAPPGLVKRVADSFATAQEKQRSLGVKRY